MKFSFEYENFDLKEFLIDNIDNILAVCVMSVFVLCSAINAFSAPREMSEKENRELKQLPQVSAASVFDGTFMKEFETYTADQFAWRDGAVSIKADCERLLGKKGNNGVHFGKDGYLIARPAALDKENTDKNIEGIKTLYEIGGYNTTVCVVPTAFEIMKDKLPMLAYDDRIVQIQNEISNSLAGSGINVCDVNALLEEHKDEYIFYRTDHHQTELGSYYVYSALGQFLGYDPYALHVFDKTALTTDFYGTSWSKAGITFAKPDTIEKYALGFDEPTVEFPLEGKSMETMYALDNLEKKDKYTVYLDGNHALTVINNNLGNGRKLAVLKDSYAHSVAPLLANHYDSISLIDMRYYNEDLITYLGEQGITDILVLYSAENFNTDTNLSKAGEMALTTEYFKQPPFGYLQEQNPVGDDYFADAVFFGDSLTVGHSYYATVPARFVCKSATNTTTVHTFTMDSGKTVMQELLDTPDVGKYYIMFGINELSFTPIDIYIGGYRKMIDMIKQINPEAIIYIQSVLPIERSAKNFDASFPAKIVEANTALCALAEEMGCYYLDIYSTMADPQGYLRDGAAADGIHFAKTEHDMWEQYTKTHAVVIRRPGREIKQTQLYSGGGTADINAFVNEIMTSIAFKDSMSPVNDSVAARMFSLGENAALQGAVYMSGGSTAEEFAIFETATDEEALAIAEKMRAQVENRKPDFVTYKPEEMTKLNNPVIAVNGHIVMMCISDDNDTAAQIMSRY